MKTIQKQKNAPQLQRSDISHPSTQCWSKTTPPTNNHKSNQPSEKPRDFIRKNEHADLVLIPVPTENKVLPSPEITELYGCIFYSDHVDNSKKI